MIDIQAIRRIAEDAGQLIMTVYQRDIAAQFKADESPLTMADLLAHRHILAELARLTPEIPVLSEEGAEIDGTLRCSWKRYWLVDPLDGTKEFLKRNDEFTVNIALVHQGQAIAGVVLAPALGELFYAARGLGAWQQDAQGQGPRAMQASTYHAGQPLRVMGSRSHGGEALVAWLSRLPHGYTFVAAGSSLKFCRIAAGQADIYPRFGPTSQWDTAAAQCVLEAAGGAVVDFSGAPLRYGLDKPVLNPEFVAVGDSRASLVGARFIAR